MNKKEDTKDSKYYPSEIEAKWQKVWEEQETFSPDVKNAKNPFYNLMMFPYPSAEGLHVGNMYAFTGADVYARYNRMLGKDVFEPIGLDGFGIHSENYALKIGVHPKEQAQIAERNFYRQLRSIGNSFDWQRTVETYNPNYYKWTQWLFIQMFKNGLAYRDTALVNWCPKDLTVLSDEQVIDGCCERCSTRVEKKNLEQWFFRITKYADRLLNNIDGLAWSEKVKTAQRNWIGRSEGAEVEFLIMNHESRIKVFTTRPDTLFGATFMVLSPEYLGLDEILKQDQDDDIKKEVENYRNEAKSKTEIDRTRSASSLQFGGRAGQASSENEKTGVFSGLYALNPVNGEKIPIWIADYVLAGYGTGAIMAVPAHDSRDFAFATKYNLPIVSVIANVVKQSNDSGQARMTEGVNDLIEAYEGTGKLINSGEWDGIEVPKEMGKVLDWLENKGWGTRKANFHLRDWLISRQRYWGAPIPMIFCLTCKKNGKAKVSGMEGWFSVSEDQLPVLLPDVEDWKPMGTGKSPLANHPEFYKTTCPNCGGEAKRETDVSDTFLDSSWYFLRYPSVKNQKSKVKSQSLNSKVESWKNDIEKEPFERDITKKWLPVDQYIGGAEHSVLHLLYSRFVTMVLHDLKFIDFDEPFTNFFAHGLIIKDGVKMSKSKGNVVVPDTYIEKYGSDTLRCYVMFIGPYSDGGDFRDTGIEGMNKFLRKVWRLLSDVILSEAKDLDSWAHPQNDISERLNMMHKTIQKVTKDISKFGYNTAIAALMEWYNYLSAQRIGDRNQVSVEEKEALLKLLAPFAPHLTEELWQVLKADSGHVTAYKSIHLESWPEFDEKYLVKNTIIIPVQINGKRRGEISLSVQETGDSVQVENKAREVVAKNLEGIEVKKIIYLTGKIINFVV